MEKEQLHKKLDDFLSGSNKEKVDKELFSLLVRMDECRKKATPPDKDRMWEQVCRTLKHSRRRELVRRYLVLWSSFQRGRSDVGERGKTSSSIAYLE